MPCRHHLQMAILSAPPNPSSPFFLFGGLIPFFLLEIRLISRLNHTFHPIRERNSLAEFGMPNSNAALSSLTRLSITLIAWEYLPFVISNKYIVDYC